jgi:hypothetical protein
MLTYEEQLPEQQLPEEARISLEAAEELPFR